MESGKSDNMNNKNKTISAFCNDALGNMDAVALAQSIAKGEINASEAIEAAIARAEKVNPQLNAIVTKTYDLARNQAKNPVPGPFSGIPTFVKDTDDIKGVPTLWGSRAFSGKPARKTGKFVRQFCSTGLIVLGKSSLCEFGMTATTEPLAFGPTCNPWHRDHSAGGSSGGSAALVAAGVVPIAHGNDGGGSIRIPAACCGLVGLKPSLNRLKHKEGTKLMPINIVHQGVVSRSVRDTAAFYAAAEKVYRNPRLPEMGLIEHPGKQRFRIGILSGDIIGKVCDADTIAALDGAGKLCAELGHHVEKITVHHVLSQKLPALERDFIAYWAMLAFSFHHFGKILCGLDYDKKKIEKFSLELSRYFRKNLLGYPSMVRRLRIISREIEEELYQQYHIILAPVLTQEPVKLGFFPPESSFESNMDRLRNYCPFTPLQNITGSPAISLPLGQSRKGLPIGMQFASTFGHDRRLIELAYELESCQSWATLFT